MSWQKEKLLLEAQQEIRLLNIENERNIDHTLCITTGYYQKITESLETPELIMNHGLVPMDILYLTMLFVGNQFKDLHAIESANRIKDFIVNQDEPLVQDPYKWPPNGRDPCKPTFCCLCYICCYSVCHFVSCGCCCGHCG